MSRKNRTILEKVVNTTVKPKTLAGEIFCCLLIISICLVAGVPRYLVNIDLADEGFLDYGAVRVMEGQIPNRDFVSLQPPLSFYTIAVVFKLFGTSLVSERTFGLCIYILIALLVYAISRNITGHIASLLAAIPATVLGMPFFYFVPFAVWQGALATLASIFLFMRSATSGRRRWAFLAGLTTAAAMLCRHDQGFYLAVAILIYVLAVKFARHNVNDKPYIGQMLGFWAAGIIVIMLLAGVYWLIHGAVPYMFRQLVVFPLTTYAKTSSLPMPVFHAELPLRENIVVGMFYLPPVVYALATIWIVAILIRRRFSMKHAGIGFMLAMSILFYCQVLTRSDLHHLLITLPPFFILGAWCTRAVSEAAGNAIKERHRRFGIPSPQALKTAVLLAVGITTVLFLLYIKPMFLKSPKTTGTVLSSDRGGVWLETRYAKAVSKFIYIIHKNSRPDEAILCLPYTPMFYFLSGRHNPTHWNYLWAGDQTVNDHLALVEQAKKDPPAIVMTTENPWVQVYAPIIYAYIKAEYKVAYDFGTVTIYLPLKPKNQ